MSVYYRSGGTPGSSRAITIRRLSDNKMRIASSGLYETEDDSHIANYAHPLTEISKGQFELLFPEITGTYWVADFELASSNLQLSDFPSLLDVPEFDASGASSGEGSKPPDINIEMNEISGT